MKNHQKAVNEYRRVAKPGGYVGFNEVTWMETPSPELVEYLLRITGAIPDSPDCWRGLLEGSGLTNVVVKIYRVNALSQWLNEIRTLDIDERAPHQPFRLPRLPLAFARKGNA